MTIERKSRESVPTTKLSTPDSSGGAAIRITSQELFRQAKEVEIDHEGRIYRLRLTQLNKLILTA